MTDDTPLSQHLARLAAWADRIRNGTHEFTQQGKEDFAAVLHLCSDRAAEIEAELQEARQEARSGSFGAAALRIAEQIGPVGAAVATISSDHLTTLYEIAVGHVPGVVLFPRPHRAAVRVKECPHSRPGGPDGDGGHAA